MKSFRYPSGHHCGDTMTVGELRALLAEYPDDMPALVTWEGVYRFIQPDGFEVKDYWGPHPEDFAWCLVIDAERST